MANVWRIFGVLVLCICVGRSQADPTESTPVTYAVPANTSAHTNQTVYISPHGCTIRTKDVFMTNRIMELLAMSVKLINYNFSFPEYEVNPLLVNMTWHYKANSWSRVSNQHGQTLLSLAFNYGVLSLMTLTFGVEKQDIELLDSPAQCFGKLSEMDKIDLIGNLTLRDFRPVSNVTFVNDERMCHEVVDVQGNVAYFRDRCCHRSRITGETICSTDFKNIWLTILYVLLSFVRYGLLFFGPILFIPFVESMARDHVPYCVKLKEPLFKTIFLARGEDTPIPVEYKYVLDFRKCPGVFKLRESAAEFPVGEPVKVKITQYDIDVCYKRLLTENEVPVGLWTCIANQIFKCKLKSLPPFKRCCDTNMFRTCPSREPRPWKWFWQKIGLLLMVVLIPTPLYLRILIFYVFEYDEVMERKLFIENLGYEENYQNNLTHYLTPTHWIFITVYILYFVTAIILAYMARKTEEGRFRRIIIGSFRDLKNMSWIALLQLIVTNLVWPFKRYGLAGCAVALVYWPIALPLSLIIFLLYCLPSVYVTIRMLTYSKVALVDRVRRSNKKRSYRIKKSLDISLKAFEASKILDDGASMSTKSKGRGSQVSLATLQAAQVCPPRRDMNWRRFIEHLMAAILCVLTMYGMLLILSECAGCLVEIFVFTMMGVIVNAGAILKYCTLLFLVVLYSYSCFNNVPKKYLKLNKSLFGEVKGRIKDLEKVTSLPSYLQENFGFKSQEISEQADYESPDEIIKELTLHWMINDLVLFIDNEDMPRIPKKLFEDVCEIRVAGSPGPVYRSHLEAFQQFLMIVLFLLFVFIIVLSFGQVYKVSTTNQMAATMAGGFLPFVLKTFMQPSKPEIELGTVSFKSKCDEIIKNFFQYWPIYDFPFEEVTEEDLKKDEEDEEGEDGDKDKKDDNDKEKDKKDDKDKMKDKEKKEDNTNNNDKKAEKEPRIVSREERHKLREAKAEAKSEAVDHKPPPPGYQASFGAQYEMKNLLPTAEDFPDAPILKKPLDLPGEEEALVPPFSKEDQRTAFDIRGQLFSPQDEVQEVDYLIYLPEVFDENWLQEWSDIEEYGNEPQSCPKDNPDPNGQVHKESEQIV